MAFLLDSSELPGRDWTNSRETSFRSVRLPFQRSPFLRCISASRNYRQGQPVRYLWIQLTLTNGPADASKLVERFRTRYYRNQRTKLVAEREMTGYQLPRLAEPQLYERETVRRSQHYVNRHLSGRVGDVCLYLVAGGSGGGWDWSDTIDFATAQVKKLERLRALTN
jgi:hypothetical protein